MRNKILIGAGILLTVFIVFLIIICGASSGGNNTLPEEELKEGDIKEGVITRIKTFGAFVEVLPGVEALLPQSALAEYQNQNNCILKNGDKINTKIIKFNPKDKRISLGLPTDDTPAAE